MLQSSFFKALPGAERSLAQKGAIFVGVTTGAVSYLHYRKWLSKEFKMGHAAHRLGSPATNITPFAQSYYHWWRMPRQEFDVYYRFMPFYVTGQLDTTKEVLIPREKDGQAGYDVISPLYCYDGGRFSISRAFKGEDHVVIDKSALLINRGWIPASKKDRLTRPRDVHTNKLVRITGTWRKGKNLHDYKHPNSPEDNEWHNLQLEDIGMYFDLPNFDEMKHYYFQATNVRGQQELNQAYPDAPEPYSVEETVYDYYQWWTSIETNRRVFQGLGAVSAASFLFALAL